MWGKKAILPYKILFVAVVVVGPVLALDLVWTIADILNALMAIPNLIAVLLLSGVIAKETKYYLSHLFSKKTGISLFRYLTQKRLMEARQLLARGVTPSEVCQRCGFGDYANFYRAFKEQFGQSPRDFSGKENGR